MKNLIQEFNQLKSNEQIYFLKLLQESFILQEGIKSAKEKYLDKIGEDKFNELIQIDPTKTKKYLDWICKQYINGVDIDKLYNIIDRFNDKVKRNLIKNKDINFYKSIEDLENALNETPEKSKTEQKKDIKLQDANLILDNAKFFIVQPLTWEASKLYGKGTQWCTAAEDDSFHWDDYTKKGNIFFYVRNKKYEDKGINSNPRYKIAIQIPEYITGKGSKINFKEIPCYFWNAEDHNTRHTLEDVHKLFGISYENLKRNIKVMAKEWVEKWLNEYGIENYIVNDDLTVDVNGDVFLYNQSLKEIPIRFGKVYGDFDCSENNLESLDWHPKYVEEDFDCSENWDLTYDYLKNFDFSFVMGKVKTDYEDINKYWNITNFDFNSKEGIEKYLKKYGVTDYTINDDLTINVNGNVDLENGNIDIIKVKFNIVQGYFNCSYNILESLEGSPNKIGGNFVCEYTYLESLKGSPKYVKGNFYCGVNNLLSSLEGHPDYVGGDFDCSNNSGLTYDYLKNYDFSFVKGKIFTGYDDTNNYWNKDK